MMDEKRIIELLAEYLLKTDRMLDKMDKHEQLLEKQFDRLDVSYLVLVAHSEKIDDTREQTTELQRQTGQLQKQNEKLQLHTEKLQQQTEKLQQQTEKLQQQTEELQQQTGEIHLQTAELKNQTKELRQQTKEGKAETAKINRQLLRQTTLNESLLKEILALSKKVVKIEGKR